MATEALTRATFKQKEVDNIPKGAKILSKDVSITVEEIENGFLVCLDEYGERKGKYESIYKKYFAKENPLSEDDLKLDDGLDKAIDNFVNNM